MAKFQARARTVEMLGRQQIAGIPTAISELFKNAHDAYADVVVANYVRDQNLFVLRDDGVGMTRDDFEQRWLTLGTESKIDPARRIRRPQGKAERPIIGEKGIGRLAIAALGPQVLVLTRGPDSKIVTSFVNWRLFAIPGLNLSDIEIPIREYGPIPDAQVVAALKDECLSNLKQLRTRMPSKDYESISSEIMSFNADPAKVAAMLRGPSLRSSRGTQLFISPVNGLLNVSLSQNKDSESELARILLGFTNTMTPGHSPPVIKTYFYDHRKPNEIVDIINEAEFFTPKEFRDADHHISGKFDDNGVFRGRIQIFDKVFKQEQISPPMPRVSGTGCGPFKIQVAILQGRASETRLVPDEWARLIRKTKELGGVYIYKDSLRILPYGGPDYDWLQIELLRTKGAGYYFFSYRRMFGAVELTRAYNSRLREKAGREGFQENAAYREFRSLVKNLFAQVTALYFRESGEHYSVFDEQRNENLRLARARETAEYERKQLQRDLRANLAKLTTAIENGDPDTRAKSIISAMDRELREAVRKDGPEAAIGAAETRAMSAVERLRDDYQLTAPRGAGLPPGLRSEAQSYAAAYRRLDQLVFRRAFERINVLVQSALAGAGLKLNQEDRIRKALEGASGRATSLLEQDLGQIESQCKELAQKVTQAVRNYKKQLDGEFQAIRDDLRRNRPNGKPEEWAIRQTSYDRRLAEVALTAHGNLEEVKTQLKHIDPGTNGGASRLAIFEAAEDELLQLRERSDEDLELAQLGMAVQVINHEFDATIRSIRAGLRQLKTYARVSRSLTPIYEQLTTSFEHLDSYLTLFTPLQRRLYRKSVRISGGEIARFLQDLFSERLQKDKIEVQVTPAFKRYTFEGIRSTFYPVFVNLTDNAVFWLQRTKGVRNLRLDATEHSMLISNSGPAIEPADQRVVFEYGFSRKPGGQGLGLYISRQVLRREGYDISTAPPPQGYNVTFVIEEATRG